MAAKIFVNLPVKDLDKTIKFFTVLGFKFNPQFTDENATCMIISDNIFVMLLVEKFFKTFIKNDIADAKKVTEAIIALSLESKEKVDEMLHKAKEAGAELSVNVQDYEWMYTRTFQDPDGHQWEFFYMDESKIKQK